MSPEQPSSKIGRSVGEKLRAARIAQHYTQSQLAAPDFSVSYISAIERGQIHPSLRALEILATRLGLTSTQLLPNRSQQDERLNVSGNHIERDEDEVELALLENHILLMQGKATEAIEQLENISTKRLQQLHQLHHRYLLGWAYYQANHFQESEYILSEALQIAKEIGAQYLHLRVLNQLAMSYAAMRNFTQALQAHQRALELAESSEPYDPFFCIQVYMQMGQHYTRLGTLESALAMFHKALDITAELASESNIQAVYANLSHYYATKKDDNLAILYAYKSAQLHNQESIKRLRSELHHYLGHAIMQGDQDQARIYLDEIIHSVSIQQDPLAMASIATRNAEWYFTKNALPEAAEAARQAEELANAFGNTIIRAEALIMQGRIDYAEQHHEAGNQHLIAGLDMLEQLGSHQELADESVRYAQLLEGIGREHEAFTHFRRAFQSKQKIGK